jgi:hypothetical protein
LSGANRKNPEPRHLAERYTLRRRVLSAKFTRAGDRHLAHTQEDDADLVAASGSSPSAGIGEGELASSGGDLANTAPSGPVASTDDVDSAPEPTEKEAQL